MAQVIGFVELVLAILTGLSAFPYARKLTQKRQQIDDRWNWVNPWHETSEDVLTYILMIGVFGFFLPGLTGIIVIRLTQEVFGTAVVHTPLIFVASYVVGFILGFGNVSFPKWFSKWFGAIVVVALLLPLLVSCGRQYPPSGNPDFPSFDGSWFVDDDGIVPAATEQLGSNQAVQMCSLGLGTVAYVTHDERVTQTQEYTNRLRKNENVDVLWGIYVHVESGQPHIVYALSDSPQGKKLQSGQLDAVAAEANALAASGNWQAAINLLIVKTSVVLEYDPATPWLVAPKSCLPPKINWVVVLGALFSFLIIWSLFCFMYGAITGDVEGATELWVRGMMIFVKALAKSKRR